MQSNVLVKADHLKKYFYLGSKRTLKAVDDVTLEIHHGETLALVGESGCGKSTFGRTIIGAYSPSSGTVKYDGVNYEKAKRKERRAFTRKSQMIFQDPYSALNPRMTVADIIGEGIDIHKMYRGIERNEKIASLLSMVGLSPSVGSRFTHEFSGGQLQRISIARALAVEPEFLVCDEPISALDVSVQAQIVNLLKKLQKQLRLTNLFIAHDLNMVRYISNRTAVMYLGRIVEIGNSQDVYDRPLHPYTKVLLSSVPEADPSAGQGKKPISMGGELPNPLNPPEGCAFCTRCPLAKDRCRTERPKLTEVEPGRKIACFLRDQPAENN